MVTKIGVGIPEFFGGNPTSEYASKNWTYDALKKSCRGSNLQRGFVQYLADLRRLNSRYRIFFYLDLRGPIEFAFDPI